MEQETEIEDPAADEADVSGEALSHEEALLPHLSDSPTHLDELTQLTGLPAGDVAAALLRMELENTVENVGKGYYKLVNDGVVVRETKNTRTLYAATDVIHTLDQLLEVTETDLKTWYVERHVLNPWGVTMKGPDGQPIYRNNWQVKAWMRRREPVATMPVIQPVKIRRREPAGGDNGRVLRDIKTALILPDPQFGFIRDVHSGEMKPFHDRRALSVMLQICKTIRPDVVVWLGDVLDLPGFSNKFLAKPGFYWTVQSAVIEAHWWISQFVLAAPDAEHYVIEGNHDKRLETAVIDRFAMAYELKPADRIDHPPALSVPGLLALDQLGVDYVGDYPNGQVWLTPDCVCVHGSTVASNPGATVGKVAQKADVTVLFGHVHRSEHASHTTYGYRKRRVVRAHCFGCLCQVSGDVPGTKKEQDWQNGGGVVRYTDKGKIPPEVLHVEIENGRAMFEGTLYTGRNPRRKIAGDTGWEPLLAT